ncbi:hypothetical protein SOQ14_05930 [Erythrobacter sp. T5W1-R]|uniref:hypothetical protein n=1 Tax=Erythrobacter sp. T5W1-R TaxID=3101752 RepID=UPI002AFDFC08|nr:hypothetical protein [Erythrobacter sp. T5W1-R]MEA1618451.1 hypothetical protein [Erythrobacter sp. T5W1-R]
MTLTSRAKSAYRALERFAEALEPDPMEELRRRVARLERQAFGEQAFPHAPTDREQTADPDG